MHTLHEKEFLGEEAVRVVGASGRGLSPYDEIINSKEYKVRIVDDSISHLLESRAIATAISRHRGKTHI